VRYWRDILIAGGIAAALALAGVAVLVARNLEVHVPVAPPEEIAAMSDIELCQLEHRILTGIALRELGPSGLVSLYGLPWSVLFVTIFVGCLSFSRLARGSPAS